MTVASIYNNYIYNKNKEYSRSALLESISSAKREIYAWCNDLQSPEIKQNIHDIIVDSGGCSVAEYDNYWLVQIAGVVYCLVFDEVSMNDISDRANELALSEYVMVSSTVAFIIKYMTNKLFLLLLRDYDSLSFIPEEYQRIQRALIS